MRLVAVLAVVLVLAGWFFVFRPETMGGPTGYILVSGASMEPKYFTGDLVLTRRHRSYSIGDIIAFRVPEGETGAGQRVIHRIVGGDGVDGYITQGDNNSFLDPWHPKNNDVIGKRWLEVAAGEKYVNAVRTPQAFAAGAVFLASLGILGGGKVTPRRHRGSAIVVRKAI